ncbi:GldG family protein [Actomonas aquatica]|uniref:GldG family protein n=1 Tax=Actomonas aquatica TaxID=2866162 RepID=A0ABZ1CFX8_9BACT|nr:GldG family protein [Opitutus sp. WL0086]WRQ89469.1 GldG family protein [Opitutus sp. WL0086]
MKPSAKLTAAALLFVGLVLINYLASQLPFRADATAENIYTLSPGTKSLLSKIEEPVVLDFYYSRNAEGVRIDYKNYAARVEEMLRQYERAARGKLVLNLINPEPDTPEEEAATRAGIQPQVFPGAMSQIYFGLSATQADLQEALPAFNPRREQFLEYDLSQLIYSVQVFEKRRLGLITSLPLQAPPFNPMMQQMGQRPPPDQFVIGEWQRTFEIVPIEATATELPANLDVLVIAHPQGLSPELEYAIDQALLGGTPVLLALDPSSEHFKRQTNPQQMMMGGGAPNLSSDLPDLLNAYGITYVSGSITGDLEYGAQVQTGAGQIATFPHWLQLPVEAFNTEVLPTAQLNTMVLIETGHLALATGSDLEFTPLIQTSTQAGDIPPAVLQFGMSNNIAGELSLSGQQTLAAMVTGTFPTAFPDGPPESENVGSELARAPTVESGQGTLVIIADTDWLMDDYSVRRVNLFGMQAAEPINDNLAFASNVVEYLAGSQDLISIRTKGSSQHPFTVVREMEAAAQQRYQEQLAALESRLSEVQAQLSQLQSQVGDNGMLVASPEVAASIAEYQTQEAEMRRERRDIRRALREDIDALKQRLVFTNLLAAPLLLAGFGLWLNRTRRRRH